MLRTFKSKISWVYLETPLNFTGNLLSDLRNRYSLMKEKLEFYNSFTLGLLLNRLLIMSRILVVNIRVNNELNHLLYDWHYYYTENVLLCSLNTSKYFLS